MELISSLQNKQVRDAVRLHTSRGRKQQNRIIIFGTREIERAMAADVPIVSIFVSENLELPAAIKKSNVETIQITEAVFQKLAYGNRVDGPIAIATRPDRSIERFQASDGVILVIESIEKPGNLGAMFRTADATAAGGIIVSNPVCDMFHPNAIRNSTGTTFSLPSAVATNEQTISWLREHGYRILMATPDQANDLYDIDFNLRCALVLGSEAHGLSDTWLQSDFSRVQLPMNGIADSLNVSVAAAVMMYEALRQKTARK